MRTTTHALTPDRIVLPRRLVQRRLSGHAAEIRKAVMAAPARFEEGDIIQFRCAEGRNRWITVLGIEPDGHVDAMAYNGQPHYCPLRLTDLMRLRVEHVERMPPSAVTEYRRLLNLDAEFEVAE